MDRSKSMGIDKLIRIGVLIDVNKVLIQTVKRKMRNRMEERFEVKYEKPPLFCFLYGKIGHGDDCKDEEDPPLTMGFG
ncbi:DNA-directed RNA polymerase subunit beta' [Bienertia sinuspersici]